jgi:hypothetical protein
MNAFWAYFWPAFALGLAAGLIAGAFGFRKKSRRLIALGGGVAAAILLAALWHGPFGGADLFTAKVNRGIRYTLVYFEMTQVKAQLHHNPLTRQVQLSGPADDFQRRELVRLMNELPGVSGTSWSPGGGGVPLIAEGAGVSLLGFLLGLVLAYLIELRRRYNLQWNW